MLGDIPLTENQMMYLANRFRAHVSALAPWLTTALAAILAGCGTSPTVYSADTADAGPDAIDAASEVGADVGIDAPNDVATEDAVPEVGPPDVADVSVDSSEDTEPPPPDAEPDAPAPDVPPSPEIEQACIDACAARDEDGMGGCPVAGGDEDCTEWCIEVGPRVSPDLFDAYFQCLAEDPLCFQSVLQCAVGLAYPEPFAHTVTVRGIGYDAWNGDTVFAGLEESAESFVRAEAIVEDGQFTLEFDVVMHVSQSHLTLFYIDANANGACDPVEDETGTGSLDLWSLPPEMIELPDWDIEVTYDPERDSSFVCTYL